MPRGLAREDEALPISPGPPGAITLLFDLNGMLIQSRGEEHRNAARPAAAPFEPRPGLKHVLPLLARFRVGLYTSSTTRTVKKRITALVAWLREQAELKVRCSQQIQNLATRSMGAGETQERARFHSPRTRNSCCDFLPFRN
jgi:hypothetical protein